MPFIFHESESPERSNLITVLKPHFCVNVFAIEVLTILHYSGIISTLLPLKYLIKKPEWKYGIYF